MVKIAILGLGVVGTGVAEVLAQNAEKVSSSAADEIVLKYVLDIRDCSGSPFADLVVPDFDRILADPEIRVVVETIGGVGAAYDFTKRALEAGKSVVTSNKELVAAHGYELLTIAKEQNANYLFEASVGGGIPILRPISQCLAANEITEIYGIVNGTTNYILTEVAKGVPFETALKDAQALGYAEQDPTADIEGHDACRKICILGSLAFGQHIYPSQVPTEGISKITPEDMLYANSVGRKIKLLGRALRTDSGKIAVYVAPHLIHTSALLAHIDGVCNGIDVRGNALGDVLFYGPGAGKLPTASAVVADVIDCAKHLHARKYLAWSKGGPDIASDPGTLPSRWYVRTPKGGDKAFGPVEHLSCEGQNPDHIAFLTGPISQQDLAPKLAAANACCAFRLLD
ncbi:MAG: homoserine dehydrogenase [Oscillospiraceae bacterium]|nr:homoserine dehydrogenase [Oscillospiraceae bacterium]